MIKQEQRVLKVPVQQVLPEEKRYLPGSQPVQ
jgi:hypothetical protein